MMSISRTSSESANQTVPVKLMQNLKIMAHQGIQGEYPSNSFEAIIQSFGKADAVEFDIYAVPSSKNPLEKVLVCCHPETYFLYVNKAGMSNTENLPLTFEETQNLFWNGAKLIPSFEDVIQEYAKRCSQLNKKTELQIELKGPGTPEVIVKSIQNLISRNLISYDDFLVTGLCYPNDRSRIEIPHSLDPQIRKVLVLRGGNFEQDGFSDWNDVIDFAKSKNVICITTARRGITAHEINLIKSNGLKVGCFHSRTTDELEAALALGVDYVAADFYQGPSVSDYPNARLLGTPFYNQLLESGFFTIRDWIWELGWNCEAIRKDPSQSNKLNITANNNLGITSCDAFLEHDYLNNQIKLGLYEQDGNNRVLNYGSIPIDYKFLGSVDLINNTDEMNFSNFLSESFLVRTYCNLVEHISPESKQLIQTLKPNLNFSAISQLSEGYSEAITKLPNISLDAEQFNKLKDLARELLTRQGRVLGMLAFTALMPRHAEKDNFKIIVSSPLTKDSFWAKNSAKEQIQAQLLRSGKKATICFE